MVRALIRWAGGLRTLVVPSVLLTVGIATTVVPHRQTTGAARAVTVTAGADYFNGIYHAGDKLLQFAPFIPKTGARRAAGSPWAA
jgi:hypothetical protein